MPGSGGVYAVKRRKKPVQKIPKAPPVKTNPSKRHRDRLNVELDHLTALLPFSEEVRGRLDKLSVLRLSVGYLKVKSYFNATLPKRSSPPVAVNGRNGQSVSLDGVAFSEGEHLLQALYGFVLVVTTDGTVFYTSPTIQEFLGFHQSDLVHQSVYDLIHTDDREMFKCQLHFALNPSDSNMRAEDVQSCSKPSSSSSVSRPQYVPPENSSFLDRSFCCRFRCLMDNMSGFLALNLNGRLKYLHLQGSAGADGKAAAPQLALFAIVTPVQPPSVMEIRTKTLIFQTKHSMDFAPLGIDTRGKLVLGYTEIELVTTRSGYQFIHAADMMYCADNHLRMMKNGDSGFTFFRLLTKTGHWLWVQATARVVFKAGKPDFIIARQKALTDEEGEEHLHQRRRQLPFNLATGEGVLYNLSLDDCSFPPPPPASSGSSSEKPLDPASLLGSLQRQDHSIYTRPQKPSPQLSIFDQIEDLDLDLDLDLDAPQQSSFEEAFTDSNALLSVPGQNQASPKRPMAGDVTSEAMMDSLEQILADIGGGGSVEGLQVEDSELRDWENTLVRMNQERDDATRELDRILANDVFSYVEEALRRETGAGGGIGIGIVQGLDPSPGSGNGLSSLGGNPGSVISNNKPQWPVTDYTCGFAVQEPSGDVSTGFSCSSGLRSTSQVASTGCRNTQQGHNPSLRVMSTQSYNVTQQSWLPPTHNANNIHQSGFQNGRYHLNHGSSRQTFTGQQFHCPSPWQQQQQQQQLQQQSFPHHHHQQQQQQQRLTGSCMYEKSEGQMPSAAAATTGPAPGHNGPLLGPAALRGPQYQGGGHSSNQNAHHVGMATMRPDYPPGNGSCCFFPQVSKVPLNGVVDPLAFPPHPSGNVNLSQNTGQ